MNYLERNELIMVEVTQQLEKGTFQRGQETGPRGTSMKFASIGSFPSLVLGRDLFVGLKEEIEGDTVDIRVDMELARIAVIAKHLPDLEPALPMFHGLMVDSAGRKSAIITEDFSEGGLYKIGIDIPSVMLPRELIKIDSYLREWEESELKKMCFIVGGIGRLRIGDFDSFLFGQNMEQVLTRFPIDCTFEDFIRYTERNRVYCRYPL